MDIYPASTSNQITEEYYFFLVGEMNRGVTSKKVSQVIHHNGSYVYHTYHLISVP